MRSSTAGRELVRLGRRGGRLGEAHARWRRAPPAAAVPERPRSARSRIRTREIVASPILSRGSEMLDEAEPRAAAVPGLDLQLVGERADDGDAEAALAHPVGLRGLVQHESLTLVGHLD